MENPQTVEQVGELGLLQRLFRYCPSDRVGDDGALLDLPVGRRLVVTTDVLVDGVHFSDRTTDPEDVGWRAVAANLSDLAAMGATPEGITVGLSLPGKTPVAWVERLYQGMATCLGHWGGAVIGGDLCRSNTISLAITALGSVAPGGVLYRRGAEPGQVIVATGYHGLSRAGLELLLNPEAGAEVALADRAHWIQAHRRPVPRLDVIAALTTLLGENFGETAIAAIDSSDGLANAVLHLCQASGVGARLPQSHLPIDPRMVAWVGHQQAMDWCLYGGEDFELVLCLPLAIAQALRAELKGNCAIIGQVTADTAVEIWPENYLLGEKTALSFSQGFQHF
ncbi:MAG: thiamine-phosphate kinase [Nodosilinea sp.]